MKRAIAGLALAAPQTGSVDAGQAIAAAGGLIPELQRAPVIDGRIDDAAWDVALVQEIGHELQPGDNIPAPVRTTVRIGHTDEALYVALPHDPDYELIYEDDAFLIYRLQ